MSNYNGRKRRRNRVIRTTTLAITPLLIVTAISGHWVLKTFEDDIRTAIFNSKLDDFVIEQPIDNRDETELDKIVITEPTFSPTTSPIVEEETSPFENSGDIPGDEEKPFERVSSELYDMGYEIPTIDFNGLNAINQDVQGWIRIDGTNIDFPLLQGEDNAYYLKHDIENKSNVNGAIFLDYRNSPITNDMADLDDVSYIYGHHMKSGVMFAPLCNFKNQKFFDEHPFAIIINENGDIYKLDFFAGMVISGTDDEILYTPDFADEEEMNAYYNEVKSRSMVSRDIDLELGDKVLALITCSYETNNSRFILYGRMSKQLEKVNEVEQTKDNSQVLSLNN